jgi:RHS repeat-associated protein
MKPSDLLVPLVLLSSLDCLPAQGDFANATAPAQTLSISDQRPVRDLDAPQVVPNPLLTPEYTDADVFALMIFEEPLVPVAGGKDTPEERAAFVAVINAYTKAVEGRTSSVGILEGFVAAHPKSRWRAALEYNLGLIRYAGAYFTEALERYEAAYKAARNDKEPRAKALADAALAALAEMKAKLGCVAECDALVKEGFGRKAGGSSQQKFATLGEAVEVMKDPKPGFAFKCGPFALASARSSLGLEPQFTEAIAEAKSGPEGFSFAAVADIARRSGMACQVVRATPAQLAVLPVPAVIHWKLGHYAAITARSADGSQFRVVDPTFRFDRWVSADAIAVEGSGLFLTFAPNPLLAAAEPGVAEATYGRGFPSGRDPNQNKECDQQTNCGCGGTPMAGYSIHLMAVSLHVADTPIQYQHHVGPSANVRVFHNETSTIQPANNNGTSLGNQWSHNWLSYVKVSGTVPAAYTWAAVALRGGGSEDHTLLTSGTAGAMASKGNKRGLATLVYSGTTNNTFRRELPNGWVERYNRARVTAPDTYYYLTAVEDEAGNVVTVDYTTTLNRVSKLTDELGNIVNFKYQHPDDSHKVTSIEDPFSTTAVPRTANFAYSTVNGSLQLASITDPIGIVSSFGYGAGDVINSITTPYGTTNFARATAGSLDRWIEATDPIGQTERVEYRNGLSSVSPSIYTTPPSAEEPPATFTIPNHGSVSFGKTTQHLYDSQISFYWTKKMWKAVLDLRTSGTLPATAVDYDKAIAYRWLRVSPGNATLSPTLHSVRQPLEYRVWFNYPGQTNSDQGYNAEGSSNVPSKTARVVSGSTAQLTQVTSNTAGNPLVVVDPLGRRTVLDYGSNAIDLSKVRVAISGSGTATSNFTYETVYEANYPALGTDHRPTWIRTSSGTSGRLDLQWNARGQLTQLTNARNETTVNTYSAGKLTEINPGLAGASDKVVLTYDSAQRVRTRTAWAFSGTFSYDNLDRLTEIKYPDATTETWNYQFSGTGGPSLDVWRTKDRLGRFTNYAFNGQRQMTSMTDALNRTTFYEWCRCGALQKLTDPKNQITDWKYDIQGRLTEKKIAGSVVETRQYEPQRGLLTKIIDALAQEKQFVYALDDRATNLNYVNDIVSTPDVTWQWSPRYARVTHRIDGTGTTAYGYGAINTNAANLLETEDLPGANNTITYAYDKVARLFSRTIDAEPSNKIAFYRDEIGRIEGTIATSGTVGYFYSGTHGRLTSQVNTGNGQTISIGYLDNDPVKPPNARNLVTTSGSIAVAGLSYPVINAMGRIGQVTASTSTMWSGTMEYDSADQLTRANTTGGGGKDNRYTYDLAANVEEWQETVSGTSTYYPYQKDGTNFTTGILQGVTSGTGSPYLSLTRNANGNTTSWSDALSGKSETLSWDAENRLVKVSQSPGNREFVMTYDGRHRLATIEEILSGVTQKTTRLIWSGMEICEERDAATNAVLTKYFPDGEIQFVGGTWVPIWYYRDHLGSILETYSTTGTRQSQRRFDEWGRMTGSAPGAGVSKKGYTGHYQPAGLDYVMAPYRWYSPTTRSWLSRDPIGEAGGINLYGYVSNNPINYVDPTGEIAVALPVLVPVGVALGGAAILCYMNPACRDAMEDLGRAMLDDLRKGPPICETKGWDHESPNPDKTGRRGDHKNRPDGKRDRDPKEKPPVASPKPRPYNPNPRDPNPYSGPPKDGGPAPLRH